MRHQNMATDSGSRIVSAVNGVESDSILADVIGERRQGAEKGACRVARHIEETLIAAGWPRGVSCGSELALAESFGTGRAIIREAVRILETRGTARMVRGPGGGLRVLEPDAHRTIGFLVGFALFYSVSEAQIADAEHALSQIEAELAQESGVSREQRQVLDFFTGVIATLRARQQPETGVPISPTVLLTDEILRQSRAGQIVKRLLDECTAEQWTLGHRLGSEEDLCFRYGADRDAFRQALRILESAGAAETLCGRGHGVVSQSPRAGTVARLVSCHFASRGILPSCVMPIFEKISVEIVSRAAAKATPEHCHALSEALDRLQKALETRDITTIHACIYAVEDAIGQAANNPLLHVMSHSLRGYPSTLIPRDIALQTTLNKHFYSLTLPIRAAMQDHDCAGAAAAQRARATGISMAMSALTRSNARTKMH